MNIVMIAAENGAIPGGKVGGMGDVLRDVPSALATLGHRVDVIVPGYQAFSRLPGADGQGSIEVSFRGIFHTADIFRLPLAASHDNVRCWVVEHPLLAPRQAGEVYCNDPAGSPYATDGSKFAFFCAAACQMLADGVVGEFDVIHLHDWHAALVAPLARFDARFAELAGKRLVYSIHNLALQGIRPFGGDESSLRRWFPALQFPLGDVVDPRYPDCLNPMRAAINLCDRVHGVSPTYVEEIQQPSRPEDGFFGGEGLEDDLRRARREGRLVGILNGCEYPGPSPSGGFNALVDMLDRQIVEWLGDGPSVPSHHFIALRRLSRLGGRKKPPAFLVTSVGRLTTQKVLILTTVMDNGMTCLENLLAELPPSGLLVMLGSGDAELEGFFTRMAGRWENFLFVRGFSEQISAWLYGNGDLFLMPSSFEPCGISQMQAMRGGQPCLVHGVGGLLDTVTDNVDGFVFHGDNLALQAQALVARFREALALREASPRQWQHIADAAGAQRFLWRESAQRYCAELYS